LLDPTYGEYAHVLSEVIGCRYDSFSLLPEEDYKVDLVKLVTQLKTRKYDAIIIVNPNNPSGQIIPRCELEEASALIPRHTLIWIDE
ncbi:aminotransferase class I/II-fold pyridoxal phosphate-dependent enzyme, partial [Acinetobacter baumannii]